MMSHGVLRSLLIGLAVFAGGCSAMTPGKLSDVKPASDRDRVGNVYLLRGFIGIFSTGIDHLGEELNGQKVRALVYQDDQWGSLADTIAKVYQAERVTHEPIVLIGHSYGADDVVRISRKLDDKNVPVDLLITLDPVTAPAVPKNVKRCVNLYQSNGVFDELPFLRGVPLKQEKGASGQLVNANIRSDRTDLLEPGTDHFNIEKKEKIHAEVVKLVLETCVARDQWTGPRDVVPVVADSNRQTTGEQKMIWTQPEQPRQLSVNASSR